MNTIFFREFCKKTEYKYQFQSDLQHAKKVSLTLSFVSKSFVSEF